MIYKLLICENKRSFLNPVLAMTIDAEDHAFAVQVVQIVSDHFPKPNFSMRLFADEQEVLPENNSDCA